MPHNQTVQRTICRQLQCAKSRQAEYVGCAYKQLVDLAAWFTTSLVPSSLSDLQEGGAAFQIGWASAAAFWPAANSGDCGRRKKGEDEKTSVRKWGRGTSKGGQMERSVILQKQQHSLWSLWSFLYVYPNMLEVKYCHTWRKRELSTVHDVSCKQYSGMSSSLLKPLRALCTSLKSPCVDINIKLNEPDILFIMHRLAAHY